MFTSSRWAEYDKANEGRKSQFQQQLFKFSFNHWDGQTTLDTIKRSCKLLACDATQKVKPCLFRSQVVSKEPRQVCPNRCRRLPESNIENYTDTNVNDFGVYTRPHEVEMPPLVRLNCDAYACTAFLLLLTTPRRPHGNSSLRICPDDRIRASEIQTWNRKPASGDNLKVIRCVVYCGCVCGVRSLYGRLELRVRLRCGLIWVWLHGAHRPQSRCSCFPFLLLFNMCFICGVLCLV